MSEQPIWFNRPAVTGREEQYMAEALASGHLAGDGAFTRRSREALESILGAARVLLTTSCTHALEMAVMLAGVDAGDEVICPSFTFVSSVNAFVLRGARPAFVDIRPDTLNIDERLVEQAITARTRALMVVHYAGVGCELDALADIASRHGLPLIEDNAHGLFGCYRGRALGSVGATSTLSFHETKNLTCGEGGAIVINDPALVERAEIIREKGTNRSRFFRGQVDKYSWVDIGSSYLPSEILAAYLCAQIEARAAIQAKRQRDLEPLRRRAGRLERPARRHPSARAGALPAPGPPLLPAAADAGRPPGVHRASAGAVDRGGVPLSAAAPVRPGAAARRPPGTVSCHRGRVGSAGAAAAPLPHERGRPGSGDRRGDQLQAVAC